MKIYIVRIGSLVLSILTALMIYSFSADTAQESGNLSGEITDKVLSTVGVDKETTPPLEYQQIKEKTEFSIRKLAHFSEYFLLGCFLCIFFQTFPLKAWIPLLLSLAVAVPYAALDEWHQSFVPGRGPGMRDVLIDSAGSLCGAIFAMIAYRFVLHLIRKRTVSTDG